MGEDLLPQVTNDAVMDLDMGGDLMNADPAVAGHPEPDISSKEKVRGINAVQRILRRDSRDRPSALVGLR